MCMAQTPLGTTQTGAGFVSICGHGGGAGLYTAGKYNGLQDTWLAYSTAFVGNRVIYYSQHLNRIIIAPARDIIQGY